MIFDTELEQQKLEGIAARYPLPRISYSQINTFMRCPHDYYLTYMNGFREFSQNKFTALGSLLHDIFEKHGKGLIINKPLARDKAYSLYNVGFQEITRDLFDNKTDFIKMYRKGVSALDGYLEVYGEEKPTFVERKFQGKIAVGLPPMKSFIDRIDGSKDDPSSWILTDYKTGASPKSKQYLREDLQLGLYAAQVFALHGAYPKAIQFHHPVPGKLQTAVHQGDGVYKFTNQREPVVEISVADTLQTAREVVEEIVTCVYTGEWKRKAESFKCKMCMNYDTCKPFESTESGWDLI